MKKGKIINIITGIVVFCSGLFNGTSKADTDYLKILSPMNGAKVKDGELFIAVQLLDSETFKKSSVRLMMDGFIINFQAKVTDKKVTMLYLQHLRSGKHHLKMNAQTSDGGQLAVLEWDFEITSNAVDSAKMAGATPSQIKRNWDINGFISMGTRLDTATGPGKGLRQAPRINNEVSFNIEPRFKSWSMPISGYWTNTDYAYLQPRSKFRIGLKNNKFEVYYGSNFPTYDAVVLNGVRVQGVEAIFKSPRLNISVVEGDLTRAVDGTVLKVRKDTAFIPYNIRTDSRRDSFYVNPGVYRRSVIAARINGGKEQEGSIFGITLLRSQDDTNSIRFGTGPMQNIVAGADQAIITQNGVFHESAGFAMSMTTNDYSRPALTRQEIDTTLKQNFSFDPSFFKGLIIINPSTSPLLIQKLASATWFVKSTLKLWFNRFSFDYHRVGPAYESFGNPFMRNDIQEVSLADNMNFWKRRIGVQVKVVTNGDNLYNQLTNKIINNYYIASLSLTPNPKWPQFFASYRENDRITTSYIESYYKITDKLLTYNAGFNYRLPEGKAATNFNIMYSGTVRNNNALPDDNSTSDVIFATIQQNLNVPLVLSVQYSNYNTITVGGGVLQRMNTVGGSVGYNFKKPKITITAGYNTNRNDATIYTTSNARNTLMMQYRQEISKYVSYSMEAGSTNYIDATPANKYNEYYGLANLNFMF